MEDAVVLKQKNGYKGVNMLRRQTNARIMLKEESRAVTQDRSLHANGCKRNLLC